MAIFQKAVRSKAKIRLSIDGPSGSGKTHSALLLAGGLAESGKIFLIDTERDSATLETGKPGIPEFFHAPLAQPFTPARYREYINAAAGEGAEVIIIDSLSHAWAGSGGVLDMHDLATKAQRSGNSWAAWREVTPEHNALVDAILQCPCHIICTMRTKTVWEVVEGANGKKAPQKIGLKPEQREGMEYEFTVVLDLSLESHIATASKDRTSLFDGRHFVPTVDTGKELRDWLESGQDPEEISKGLLASLKAEASGIEQVFYLDDWGRQHRADFDRLQPDHRKELVGFCADLRQQILKAA
ncbi:AAA family ATPase [Desulfoprunum benzoelyticum]|nr:ATP-binding protein [Desulfoprunum benzoelyticum]MBM9531343.1 AAA family ATPase [Desulfoprunum benzoelyticum]